MQINLLCQIDKYPSSVDLREAIARANSWNLCRIKAATKIKSVWIGHHCRISNLKQFIYVHAEDNYYYDK